MKQKIMLIGNSITRILSMNAFTENGVLQFVISHRCLHLQLPEAELRCLPTVEDLG